MNLIKKITLICLVAITAIACNKDDDGASNSKKGQLKFDGKSYNLKSGFLYNYGEIETGIYNYDVVLLTTEIVFEDGEPLAPADNIFSEVYFELYTDNSQELEEGVYNFSNTVDVNTFSEFSEIAINVNFDTEEGTYYEITSGTFEVLSNNTYELSFEGNAEGKSFSGNYKGSLKTYDDFLEPKSIKAERKNFIKRK